MATATSLTAETIEEMMAGWVGVSAVQESQAALLATFNDILAAQTESLTEWNDVTLPALYAETDAASLALDSLVGTVIPDLQVQINGNVEDLQQLNDVIIPDLQTGLNSNFEWIDELNTVTLPAWQLQMDANNAAVNELNTVTLPALDARLDAVESSTGFDPTELNAAIAALEDKFPVVGDDIAADTITSNNILAHTITALEIAADTITANEIAADSITANEIAAHTITSAEIFARTITAAEIAVDTITANEIAADSITANEIASRTITALEIATDAITANEIAADSITASEIAADTITANEIATDAITANEIAAGAVTATELAAGAVTAIKIQAGTITGDKIMADTIAVTKLIISDMTNLAVDGELLDPNSATWFEVGPTSIVRVKVAGEPAYLKNKNIFSTQYVYFRNENVFETRVGDEFFISVEVSTPATNTINGVFNPALAVFDQNGGSQLWRGTEEGSVTFPPNTPWTVVQGTVKITESGLATAQFNPYTDFGTGAASGSQEIRIRKITVRRKNSGKVIIDGTLQGKHLEINTITSDQIDVGTITGDLFASEVILGGLVRAGDLDDLGIITGGYSEMGAQGIYTVDEQGDPVFFAPTASTSGAYLKAHVDLLSADVRDNFTMHGTNNSIATEAELTLSAGVEAPSVPPTLQQVWDTIQFNKTTAVPPHTPQAGYNLGTFAFSPSQATAMAYDSTWSVWIVIQQKSTGFRVWRFTNTGAIATNLSTGRPWVDDYNDRLNASVAFNDDANGFATVFKSGDDWFIWAPNNIARIPAGWIIDIAARPPTLTWDTINNNWCLVQNNGGGNGTIHVRRFTVPSGGSFPDAVSVSAINFEASSGLSSRLNGAVFGAQLGVANSWAISSADYQTVTTYSSTGVQYNDEGTYRNWAKPGPSQAFAHNGTQFASLDSAGVLTFYENWTWTTLDAAVWVGASAADTDALGTGQHETPVGTMKSITLYRRSKLKITMPETNDSGGLDDPDKWRLYFKRGGSTAPTDKTLLKKIGDIGDPNEATSITIIADPVGAAPPGGIKGQADALNNFPGADPGRIESSKLMLDGFAQLQMKGDGTGRWGDLTVDSVGRAVIGGDTGWITAALTSPWTAYGAPYATPAYRKIGNRVFLRGLAKGTGSTSGPMLTLPLGYRPGSDGIFAAVMYGLEGTFDAAGENSATFNTGAPSAGSAHNHPVNIPTLTVTTAVSFTNVAGRVTISTLGVVTAGTAAAANGTNWVSLEGISFLVD